MAWQIKQSVWKCARWARPLAIALVTSLLIAAPSRSWSQQAAAPAATPDAPAADAAAAPAATPTLPSYYAPDLKAKDSPWPDKTGAASGYWATPSAGPVGDDDPATKTPANLYDRVIHNLYSINFVWVLVAGFLVMFMQAGFMMVETGLCRAKNSSHTAAMNMMIYPLGCLAFYVYGFGLGWGNWYNGPVAPGWYSTLGPGTAVLNQGIGIGGDPATPGIFKYGLAGTKGWCLQGVEDTGVLALFF